MGTDTWISVDDRLPIVPAPKLTLQRIEFKANGRRYIGEFHCNGCFYSKDMIATTRQARSRYTGRNDLPHASHWRSADLDTDAV